MDFVQTKGRTVKPTAIGGTASPTDANVTSSIVWDPAGANTLILSTHDDAVQQTLKTFVGNGTKILRLTLDNQSAGTRIIGAYCVGVIY